MDLIEPVVGNAHRFFEHFLEFGGVFLFVAPLQVVFGEDEGEIGGRFFVDPVEEVVDAVLVGGYVFGWVVVAEVLGHPLIVVAELVAHLVFLVGLVEQQFPDLLANFLRLLAGS